PDLTRRDGSGRGRDRRGRRGQARGGGEGARRPGSGDAGQPARRCRRDADRRRGGSPVTADAPPAPVLFDIDGTLISTGGAGKNAWARAFADLYGIEANIEDVTEAGMPDQEGLAGTFRHVVGREPTPAQTAAWMAQYLGHLPETVVESTTYTVFPGVHELLTGLCASGHLLGLTTGNIEAAAHIKIARAGLNRFLAFGGYGSDSANRGE